jgi:hypothetical protein
LLVKVTTQWHVASLSCIHDIERVMNLVDVKAFIPELDFLQFEGASELHLGKEANKERNSIGRQRQE